MTRKIFRYFLWICGVMGFFFLMGGVGGMEIESISLSKGTGISVFGLILLAAVVFWGIPHYDDMPPKEKILIRSLR